MPMTDGCADWIESEPNDVIRVMDSGDRMFKGDTEGYFGVGLSALRCIRFGLLAAGRREVTDILDLPCGHGRVLRFLQAEFPEANLVACDIEAAAVEFCAKTFGAVPVHGREEPGQIQLPGRFDL